MQPCVDDPTEQDFLMQQLDSLTLEETIKISYYRSILQQKTAGTGNMLVIAKSETDLQSIMIKSEHYQLYKELELACQNDSNSIVLAGPSDKIKKLNRSQKAHGPTQNPLPSQEMAQNRGLPAMLQKLPSQNAQL